MLIFGWQRQRQQERVRERRSDYMTTRFFNLFLPKKSRANKNRQQATFKYSEPQNRDKETKSVSILVANHFRFQHGNGQIHVYI